MSTATSVPELHSQIEETRDELAQTVDALGSKLDVMKSRLKQAALIVAGSAAAGVVVVGVTRWRRRR